MRYWSGWATGVGQDPGTNDWFDYVDEWFLCIWNQWTVDFEKSFRVKEDHPLVELKLFILQEKKKVKKTRTLQVPINIAKQFIIFKTKIFVLKTGTNPVNVGVFLFLLQLFTQLFGKRLKNAKNKMSSVPAGTIRNENNHILLLFIIHEQAF